MSLSKLFSILISTILMTLLFINPSVAQGVKDASFNVITYNIRMNTSADGENAWPLRKDKVAGLLKFHQADTALWS